MTTALSSSPTLAAFTATPTTSRSASVGWGSGGWGLTPWGGSSVSVSGGAFATLPSLATSNRTPVLLSLAAAATASTFRSSPATLGFSSAPRLSGSGAPATVLGLASETDSAFAMTVLKLVRFGLATETDSAFPMTVGVSSPLANIWVDPVSGNDSTGARQSSRVAYTAPYKTVHGANDASQAGDFVAFMPGVYTPVNNPGGGWETITSDAAKGAAADVNPNSVEQGLGAVAATTNWVTWIPGVANAAKDSIQLTPFANPRLAFFANMHLIIDSSPSPGAFFIPCLNFGWTFADGRVGQNVITKDIHVQGLGIRHSKNIWMIRTEVGPNVYGAASGAGAILSSGSPIGTFETGYAGRGTGDLDEFEGPKITEVAENTRLDGMWMHDKQTRDSGSFHTSASFIANGSGWGDYNTIIDGLVTERCAVEGIFVENGTDGLCIQNCFIGVPTEPFDNTGQWATPATAAFGFSIKAPTTGYNWNHLLLRYNVFETGATVAPGQTGTFSNVRFIGNILGPLSLNTSDYPTAWTVNRNAFVTGPSGTNSLSVSSISSLYNDIDPGTAPSTSSQLDIRLSAGTKTFESWIPASTDANLGRDIAGDSRVAPFTAGPYQRT